MSRSDPPARRVAAAAALSLAVALAAGCAVAPPAPPSPTPDGIREWAGRFSVSVQSDVPGGRQDTAIGRFALVSTPTPEGPRLEIELTSPFGQVLASGRRQPGGASTLRLSDGRTTASASLDGALEQALGWPLPIERLADWLDDRFDTVLSRDAQGRVATARDSGWRIEREPRRWLLQRPHAEGQLRVVLLLDR